MDCGKKKPVDFSAGKSQLVSSGQSNNCGAIDVKIDASVLEENSPFKLLAWSFSPYMDWGSYIVSISQTASKKICALIGSIEFISHEVALYFCKSIIRSCME